MKKILSETLGCIAGLIYSWTTILITISPIVLTTIFIVNYCSKPNIIIIDKQDNDTDKSKQKSIYIAGVEYKIAMK